MCMISFKRMYVIVIIYFFTIQSLSRNMEENLQKIIFFNYTLSMMNNTYMDQSNPYFRPSQLPHPTH